MVIFIYPWLLNLELTEVCEKYVQKIGLGFGVVLLP